MEDKFCGGCGKELVLKERWSNSYSTKNGKPIFNKYLSCPDWGTGHATHHWSWIGYGYTRECDKQGEPPK